MMEDRQRSRNASHLDAKAIKSKKTGSFTSARQVALNSGERRCAATRSINAYILH
jgi:hypothetical protein